MKTSDACIAFIKKMEDFAKYPVRDYAQYSVGYGCRCNKGDYPNGITEAEADALLRKFLTQFENGINGIGQQYTQNQFDALVSFSYNVGLGWTQNKSYRIYKLAHGTQYTEAEVFDIFGSWNKAGGQVLDGLTQRRELEARMWLYGENSEKPNTQKRDGVTEDELREKVVNIMRGWVGCVQGDATHRFIIDTYNSIRPLPRGLKMGYSSAWCAAAVSAAGFLAGMQEIIFPDINCGVMVEKYQAAGRWVEDDAYVPAAEGGDLVIYYWGDDGKDDCKEHESHVGMVESCNGKTFTVIEGNMESSHICGRRTMNVNGKYIRGFCCPNYESLATAEEETMYHTLKDVPAYYRKEVDELIANGALNGKGGEGEDLILDYNEGDIRTMVVMHRDIQKMLKGITAQTVDTTAIAKEVAKKIGEMLVQETVK